MIKKLLLFVLLFSILIPSSAQIVTIPDANFKACLLANSSLNSNGDDEIQISEAQSYTGSILCQNANITDITGIEEFTSLSNTLNLSGNNITMLDLSNSPLIEQVICSNTAITSFDALGLNNLTSLILQNCTIDSFDATGLISLETLILSYNPITSLSFDSANDNLKTLGIDGVPIDNIDLSSLTGLEEVLFQQTLSLQSIDFSSNTNLKNVYMFQSGVESLDLSNNMFLEFLNVNGNQNIIALTLASGNNNTITTMDALGTPLLTCIEVDDTIDLTNPPANWFIDDTDQLSYDCESLDIQAPFFSAAKIYPNPAVDKVFIDTEEDIESVTIFSILGKPIVITNSPILDISSLKHGVYLIHVETESGKSIIEKIIKK